MSGNAKLCLLALVFFLNSCATAEYRMVKGECARDAFQQIPYEEEIKIQTLYRTVKTPVGSNCGIQANGSTRCDTSWVTKSEPYQNVIKVDANKGKRNQLINSCTERQCFARYGNARCETKKTVQNIPSSKKYSTPNEDSIKNYPLCKDIEVGTCVEYKALVPHEYKPMVPHWADQ